MMNAEGKGGGLHVVRGICPQDRTRPRPRRRNLEPGAHPQRPRRPSLRHNPGGDRPDVANRPAPHAHLSDCDRISSRTSSYQLTLNGGSPAAYLTLEITAANPLNNGYSALDITILGTYVK